MSVRFMIAGLGLVLCFGLWADDPAPPDADTLDALLQNAQEVLAGVDQEPIPTAAGETPAALQLDVHQAVEMALRQNSQVLIAEEDVAAAEARIGQARSARRPQVKSTAAYVYTPDLKTDIGASALANLFIDTTKLEPKKGTATLQVGVDQSLYAGGQIKAAIQASQHLAQSQEWKKQVTLDQVELDVKTAYYDALLSRSLVVVAQDSIRTFERHRNDAQEMLDVGAISKFEVLRAQTELGARQTDLESARTAAQIALLNMHRLLGLPDDKPIRLDGKLPWTPVTEPMEALLAAAKANRAELLALDEGIVAAEKNVRVKQGAFLPKAAASAQYQKIEGQSAIVPDGWRLTVGAQWDIYAGGKRKYDKLEAEAQVRSLQHQREDLERLVDLDVRQAYLRAQEAVAKIKREKANVALGEEGQRLAELRFHEGVGTQGETLDAELAATQAKTTLVRALRDYAVALGALDKAAGRSWVARDAPRKPDPAPAAEAATDKPGKSR